jgi:ABC-type transport system substrate-binding protein
MRGRASPILALVALAALASCGKGSDGPLGIGVMGSEASLFAPGVRLPPGAQELRSATGAGLVTLDAQGEIEPALADRWIVTDDGRSYIFRLREGAWPDGADLTGESARQALRNVIRQLRGTSLGLDLGQVSEVRTMAGRVVEIDLASPMPDFLRLLAQPEMALTHGGFDAGPMTMKRGTGKGTNSAELTFRPPEARGLPQESNWQKRVRALQLHALDARTALDAFDQGQVDVVLGGTLGTWPLADPGPLSRGNLRVDNALGLFGLQVERANGFLAEPNDREAVAMAIDREALLAPFNISGWTPTARIVPAAVPGGNPTGRWDNQSVEQRRAAAAARVAAWRNGPGKGQGPRLTLALAQEPGLDILFNGLAAQLQQVGITLVRVGPDKPADLTLVDQVARYAAPLWFLNQFNCSLHRGLCSSLADQAVADALPLPGGERQALLGRAEAILTASNVYIPLGSPLRWSMVRSSVEGFADNPWGIHPLPPMATIPK